MEYTPIAKVIPVDRPAAGRAAAYGLESLVVDGNDVEAVAAAVGDRVERARSGHGPSLIEADTYRLGGHSAADPAAYRPQAEVRRWRELDPLPRYRSVLRSRGTTEDELRELEASVRREVEDALASATDAPAPPAAAALTDVWAGGGSAWRN